MSPVLHCAYCKRPLTVTVFDDGIHIPYIIYKCDPCKWIEGGQPPIINSEENRLEENKFEIIENQLPKQSIFSKFIERIKFW